jgi:hypothetical protein
MGFSGLAQYVLLRAFEPVAKAMGMRMKEKMQEARRKTASDPESD